jgi:hypothetical protein
MPVNRILEVKKQITLLLGQRDFAVHMLFLMLF